MGEAPMEVEVKWEGKVGAGARVNEESHDRLGISKTSKLGTGVRPEAEPKREGEWNRVVHFSKTFSQHTTQCNHWIPYDLATMTGSASTCWGGPRGHRPRLGVQNPQVIEIVSVVITTIEDDERPIRS